MRHEPLNAMTNLVSPALRRSVSNELTLTSDHDSLERRHAMDVTPRLMSDEDPDPRTNWEPTGEGEEDGEGAKTDYPSPDLDAEDD